MAELVQALRKGRSEGISSGYMALRSLRGQMPFRQLLAATDEAAGAAVGARIVAAFGRRKCFMCTDGTAPCGTCGDTGVVDRFRCPNCEGLGVEPCPFCLGSAWYAYEDMPPEIRDASRQYRLRHVRKELDRLAEIPLAKAVASARKASPAKRRQWAPSLMKLNGRLNVLTRHEANGDPLIQRCRRSMDDIQQILDALRPPNRPKKDAGEE